MLNMVMLNMAMISRAIISMAIISMAMTKRNDITTIIRLLIGEQFAQMTLSSRKIRDHHGAAIQRH